jgi:hypothetical protein
MSSVHLLYYTPVVNSANAQFPNVCNWQEKLWQITTVTFRQADFGIFWHAKLLGERNQGNHDHNPEVLAGAGAGAGAAIGAAAGAGMGANSGPGPAGAAASGTGGTSSGSASVAFALAFLSERRLAMDTLPPSAPCRRRHFQRWLSRVQKDCEKAFVIHQSINSCVSLARALFA